MGEMQKDYVREEYPYSEITSQIISSAIEVHCVLGPGDQEIIYQGALMLGLSAYGLELERWIWMGLPNPGHWIEKIRC